MVQARQRQVLEVLLRQRPLRVLEIGCGPELLYPKAMALRFPIKQWIIVEPVKKFIQTADVLARKDRRLFIIPGFFENSLRAVREICPGPVDFIICAGMLNEVKTPKKFLTAVKMILKPHGILHVNVPNAGSLHRRLGQTMRLVHHLQDKSKRNKSLMQYHNFDMPLLKKTLQNSGFSILKSGGYFLKPFTHQQMADIKKILTPKILDGLWKLGKTLPEIATEIYANAKIKQ